MALTKLSMREARARLTQLPEELGEDAEAAAVVTRNNEPALAIMRFSTFIRLLQQLESLQESLEILSDPQMMAALHASEEDIKAGRLTSWEDYKRERGIE